MLSNSSILFGLNSAQRLANRAAMSKFSSVYVRVKQRIGYGFVHPAYRFVTKGERFQLSDQFLTSDYSFQLNVGAPVRNFGIMQEYNERRNKKLINNFLLNDRPMYWVTSSRPSNFGDPLDTKTKADNWFDENRYVLEFFRRFK